MSRRRFLAAAVDMVSGLFAGSLLAAAPVPAQTSTNSRKDLSMSNQPDTGHRARVFITGSADGLGHAAAEPLLAQGHEVVVHVRTQARLPAVKELVERGAIATIGDLSDFAQIRELASQVNAIGHMNAVIHNAGVITGTQLLVINVVAPYLLTALIQRPQRLIYLSSSMQHRWTRRPDRHGLVWPHVHGFLLGQQTFSHYAVRSRRATVAGRLQ